MKIFIEPTFALFENLEVGDMFEVVGNKYEINDRLYIKTEEIVKLSNLADALYNMGDDIEALYAFIYDERTYNCIELSSHNFYNVAGNTKVRKINSNNVEVHCN